MLRMANVEPRLMNGLQEAILLLCKAGLKYDSALSIDGLLAITVDHKEVFVVNIKENISCSPDPGDDYRLVAENQPANENEKRLVRVPRELPLTERETSAGSGDDHSPVNLVLSDSSSVTLASENCPVSLTVPGFASLPEKHATKRSISCQQFPTSHSKTAIKSPTLTISQTFARHDRGDVSPFQFGVETKATEAALSNLLHDDQYVTDVSKIKTEPEDDSSYHYQNSSQSAEEMQFQTGTSRDEHTKYSMFSAYSYNVHNFMRPELAPWSQEVAPTTAASSSITQNASSVTFPRKQLRMSDQSHCVNCGTNTTTVWRRSEQGQLLCNACGCYYKLHKVHRPRSLMRDNIRRRARRQQGLRWTMGILPGSSSGPIPFPIGWNPEDAGS